RASSAPVRDSLVPVWIVAVAIAVLLMIYLVLLVLWPSVAPPLGAIYIALDVAVPLAILVGLSRERLFVGQALAGRVAQLARDPHADPEALIAATLRDPSLRIAYCRPESGAYV